MLSNILFYHIQIQISSVFYMNNKKVFTMRSNVRRCKVSNNLLTKTTFFGKNSVFFCFCNLNPRIISEPEVKKLFQIK